MERPRELQRCPPAQLWGVTSLHRCQQPSIYAVFLSCEENKLLCLSHCIWVSCVLQLNVSLTDIRRNGETVENVTGWFWAATFQLKGTIPCASYRLCVFLLLCCFFFYRDLPNCSLLSLLCPSNPHLHKSCKAHLVHSIREPSPSLHVEWISPL